MIDSVRYFFINLLFSFKMVSLDRATDMMRRVAGVSGDIEEMYRRHPDRRPLPGGFTPPKHHSSYLDGYNAITGDYLEVDMNYVHCKKVKEPTDFDKAIEEAQLRIGESNLED